MVVKDIIYKLLHDTNGPIATIKNILDNAKHSENEGEYLVSREPLIKKSLQKILDAIDVHYTELKDSRLWYEHL